jgi:hypothetical protein
MFLLVTPVPESKQFYHKDFLITMDAWENRLTKRRHILVYVLPKGETISSDNMRGYKYSYEYWNKVGELTEKVLKRYEVELSTRKLVR